MADRPVTLAVIIGAHGVAGEVRLKLFTDTVDSLKAHKTFNGGALTLKSVRAGTNGAIARFAEIADRTAAEAARGRELTVPRDALPPLADGEYYHTDLIGLPCVSAEGAAIGTCIAVENFGASDVLEIERPDGKTFMVPMTPAAVLDCSDARILIEAAFAA
ncbi:16S rRNA processing protein RimM [Chakrabartia godavariana]|nr:16S rRNA processing protein RimM [Chakrabartia godavariana]